MSGLSLGSRQAKVLWLEPHRLVGGGQSRPIHGLPTEDQLAQVLTALPTGITKWILDDLWAPSVILRDIIEVPSGSEARDSFFRWKYSQSLALDGEQAVQALTLEENTWLLSGVPQGLRDGWTTLSARLGRPVFCMVPRWLWLYNRVAPSRETPGLLLSLCAHPEGGFTGSLLAWGRTLTLLRQWQEPVDATTWMEERVMPTANYLQREGRTPQELLVWGTTSWPGSDLVTHILPPELPVGEAI